MPHIRIILFVVAVAWCSSIGAKSAPLVLPKATAAHFCRLLVLDSEGSLSSISSYIRTHQIAPSDSLTPEQQFAEYVFGYGGWKSLRVFPHQQGTTVSWYAAGDDLPVSMDAEHRKYISEVFLRLSQEIEAGRWATADAYIDRILQYQTTFGAAHSSLHTPPSTLLPPYSTLLAIIGILLLPFLVALVCKDYRETFGRFALFMYFCRHESNQD